MNEAYFTRDGVFNHHNAHLWAGENPYGMSSHVAQQRFSMHVWAGMVGDLLVEANFLPAFLIFAEYFISLQELYATTCQTPYVVLT